MQCWRPSDWPTEIGAGVHNSMGVGVQGERRTVIVVDDSDQIRDVLTLLLEGEGYQVLPVEDGETALMMTKLLSPALITLDLGLPGEDGAQILWKLKSDPATSHIPVVVVSGQPNMPVLEGSLAPDGVLTKPFDLNDVQQLVSELIQRSV